MKLLSKSLESLIKRKAQGKYCTGPTYVYPSKEDEYTAVPQYPPIWKVNPSSEEATKRKWHDKIKRLKTVEEKLFEENVPRQWGWKCLMVHEGIIPFTNLTFAQHITKTHVIETDRLPDHYARNSEKSKVLSNEIKNNVIDAIEYQLDARKHKFSKELEPDEEKEMTKFIVTELNRVLMNNLWVKEPFLKSLQIDYSPRIEAAWKIESLVETYVPKKRLFSDIPDDEMPEEYLDRPSDKYIQYIGHPILQLRSSQPLPRVIDPSEATILAYSVPVYEYDPIFVLGYELDRRRVNNIPGFWPGDDREFSFMSYHFSNHLKHRPPTFGPEDTKEALHSQAILASFGWLMPLACYQGFSSYHDITYPMTTQTVLTDGHEFCFAVYQLSTTEMHCKNLFENLKSNICWVTPTKPLYEAFENGRLKGFNEEVLQTLIQFYINMPKPLENVQMKPYLGDKIKHIADYEDDEKVNWLEEKFKDCTVNKPSFRLRSQLRYEVQDWERIFKIDYPTRVTDARRRPYELRQNPYHEKMTEYAKEYIPKAIRPDKHLPKYKQRKFRRTYFPE